MPKVGLYDVNISKKSKFKWGEIATIIFDKTKSKDYFNALPDFRCSCSLHCRYHFPRFSGLPIPAFISPASNELPAIGKLAEDWLASKGFSTCGAWSEADQGFERCLAGKALRREIGSGSLMGCLWEGFWLRFLKKLSFLK
jgi:hypothetical protein